MSIRMFLPVLLLLSVPLLPAEEIRDALTAGIIDRKIWNIGRMGTVTPTGEGVHLSGGENENAASLMFKEKVTPDTPYDFSMEMMPLGTEMEGYAAMVGGPGWFVASRSDGGFWLQCDANVVGNLDPQPVGCWYQIQAKNRRGAVQVSISDGDGKKLAEWTAPKAAGLEGTVGATALIGTGRPGPRGMLVRNARLNILDTSDEEFLPEDEMEWLNPARWSGAGKISRKQDGSLQAELQPGEALRFRFPEPLAASQVTELIFAFSLQTTDESYNLIYTLKGPGEGYHYLNDLNRGGSLPETEVIMALELLPAFGEAPVQIEEFVLAPSFLDAPCQLTITRFQLTIRDGESE